ncbi:MAG TPA: hypothetical protein VFH39_00910, partial [Candidatus Saccharimonadales bacterium]|nr:hypothetical protein [Candidatus Saccharimonadales bacterium]
HTQSHRQTPATGPAFSVRRRPLPRRRTNKDTKDFSLSMSHARKGTQKDIPVAEAKRIVLEKISQGYKVAEATAVVGRKEETYRDWRKTDPEFRAAVDEIRKSKNELQENGRPEVPPFDEFCRDWLKQPLFPHQLRMWDVIEGRKPRDLHPSMDYLPGYRNRVVINVPPEHAKSTTFTVNYVVWLIHRNPDIRVVIMSQGKTLAQRFLGEIKFKLTSPLYREMHLRYGPADGWKSNEAEWSQDAIYVRGKGGDKDPTVQALGLGGQIYGTRADLIILDDTITTKNAREIDKQMILLEREIESRLPSDQEGGGVLAVLGTRVSPHDLYRELMDVRDADDDRVWTYFRMPAVLDYGNGDSATWETLWPEKWNGKSLSRRKRGTAWNLVYQQLNVDDDMTFKAEAVDASINGKRFPGPMTREGAGHRPGGMEGLYLVGGLDPAAAGNTAIIIAGFDRETQKRYILDGWNKPNATAEQIINRFKYFTETYGLHEWVIEQNALQRFITQLPELTEFTRARGCKITPHTTNANKYDSDWGIETMAPLFDSCGEVDEKNPNGRWKRTPAKALIELPSPRQNDWVNDLIQQLTIWQPEGMAQKQKTDLVMALWFTHIAIMRIIRRGRNKQTHLSTPYMTPAARKKQQVIDLAAMRRAKQEAIA